MRDHSSMGDRPEILVVCTHKSVDEVRPIVDEIQRRCVALLDKGRRQRNGDGQT
jgi:hypothetical protein